MILPEKEMSAEYTLTENFFFFTTYNTDSIEDWIIQIMVGFVLLLEIKSRKTIIYI